MSSKRDLNDPNLPPKKPDKIYKPKKTDRKPYKYTKTREDWKAATWRPTDYDPKYCQMLIDFMSVETHEILVDRKYYKAPDEAVIDQKKRKPLKTDELDYPTYWSIKSEDHKIVNRRFPTFQRFCANIWTYYDVLKWRARDTNVIKSKVIENWVEVEKEKEVYLHPEFNLSRRKAVEIQKSRFIEHWMDWLYNSQFAKFIWPNLFPELKDESHLKVWGTDGWPLVIRRADEWPNDEQKKE